MTNSNTVQTTNEVLFGLDVHGIQKYLFATSKLREIVGASKIVENFTSDMPTMWLNTINGSMPVRLGGGCIRCILPSTDKAQEIAQKASEWAAVYAPTLNFDHAHVPFDVKNGNLNDSLSLLVEKCNSARTNRTNGCAFAGFPFTAPCRLTSDAASGYGKDENERLCAASLAKRFAQNDATGEWADFVHGHEILSFAEDKRRPFEFEIDKLVGGDGEHSYVAVICVDLNGLGERGRSSTDGIHGRDAAQIFSEFVGSVKESVKKAFKSGLDAVVNDNASKEILRSHRNIPIRPLVMGGDDLTFVVHGSLAIPFTLGLLKSFEDSGFKSGAGIAFIKSKSPFGRAVELAESLVSNAKRAGREETRLDFMLCPGEIPASVNEGRAERTFDDRLLFSGPWKIDEFEKLIDATRDLSTLARSHVRGAVDRCRESVDSGNSAFADLLENLERGIGGRGGRSMTSDTLKHHFGETSFFHCDRIVDGTKRAVTRLLDCVDLWQFVDSGTEVPAFGGER